MRLPGTVAIAAARYRQTQFSCQRSQFSRPTWPGAGKVNLHRLHAEGLEAAERVPVAIISRMSPGRNSACAAHQRDRLGNRQAALRRARPAVVAQVALKGLAD